MSNLSVTKVSVVDFFNDLLFFSVLWNKWFVSPFPFEVAFNASLSAGGSTNHRTADICSCCFYERKTDAAVSVNVLA